MSPRNHHRPNRPNGHNGTPSHHGEPKAGGGSHPGASGVRHRTRAARVAAHFTYYGLFRQVFDALRNVEMRKQVALVVAATFAMCLATRAWNPPFSFVEYDIPERDIVCRVAFSCHEEKPFYAPQHPHYIESPPQVIPNVDAMPESPTLTPSQQLEIDEARMWLQQIENNEASSTVIPPPLPERLPDHSSEQAPKQRLPAAPVDGIPASMTPFARPEFVPVVYRDVTPDSTTSVSPQNETAGNVTTGNSAIADPQTDHGVGTQTATSEPPPKAQSPTQTQASDVPQPVLIDDELPGVLAIDENGERIRFFTPGMVLVPAGQPISRHDIRVLHAEFAELMAQRSLSEQISRFFGVFFLTLALFLLAFIFLQRRERRRPRTTKGTAFLYSLMIVTVIAASIMHESVKNGANLELIPMLLFSQGIAIAFSWELSLVLMVIISFVFVLSQANSIFTMMLLVGVTASIVIHLGRLRSRTKLIVVGSFGALIAFLLTLFIEMTEGQEITRVILTYAVLNAFWTCSAAFLMTGLLPFIERPCGILTDMSLLELGDPSHPLLHELTRRAPATYSHSLQVASIAETAAEMIGARGLLVRVGAYFHDIGKILNPDFFTENQQVGHNVHDHLEPRMSTLVIVAHVKDGVDLVRQHRIPQPIIDLVEQHHGTSLVSFFHSLAARQNREQGYSTTIDEGSFRYPGPKPQSKEAGILMLADAAESACRSLRDASPGKIEAMVRHISEDKLKDGQFDESGLTLRELRTIENSIINSILAMRHNRISYPDNSGRKTGDSAEMKPQMPVESRAPE